MKKAFVEMYEKTAVETNVLKKILIKVNATIDSWER